MSDNSKEEIPEYEFGPRDYHESNVPQDPHYYPEEEQQLPQSELDRDEARDSLGQRGPKEKPNSVGNLIGNGVGNFKEDLKDRAQEAVPGGEEARKVIDNAEKTATFVGNVKKDAVAAVAAFKTGLAALLNPVSLITLGVVLVVGVLIVTVMGVAQVYGQTRSSSTEGVVAGTTGTAQLARLAQRADWLQKNYQNYGATSGPLYDMAPGKKSNLSANAWRSACPNIVAFIYGLSPYLVNYNGYANAYKNWSNYPDQYQAYAFNTANGNGKSSPGADLRKPPAGAIVSINYKAYGHTFVMLTDELVIDNWGGGGIVFGNVGGGPRKITEANRAAITGWALPNSEGFEGTFISGSFEGAAAGSPEQAPMPGLGPVPNWAAAGSVDPGASYSGSDQHKKWMSQAGIPQADWKYVDYIVMKESSWNPKATNAGSGACGLVQALPCEKVPGDGYDPVDNLKWANGYAKERYGGWKGAYDTWKAKHWW